jgi:hypothetical protein
MYIYNNIFQSFFNELTNKINKKNIIIKKSNNLCKICNKKFNNNYSYKNLLFSELNVHQYLSHNFINYDFYLYIHNKNFINKILKSNLSYFNIHSNNFNIINSLYEFGSHKIYIEHNKYHNINNLNYKFSEHSGYIKINNNNVDKIVINTEYLIDNSDPEIFLPENYSQQLKHQYIFHTHPKTPDIGSRIKDGILYEFPSISDILHFIDHHNEGKLTGSLVFTPEGLYNIRKNIINKQKIIIDEDIFIKEIEDIYYQLFDEAIIKYKNKKINKDFFYNSISTDFYFINSINQKLSKYDISIDYYPRILFNNIWIIPNLLFPLL